MVVWYSVITLHLTAPPPWPANKGARPYMYPTGFTPRCRAFTKSCINLKQGCSNDEEEQFLHSTYVSINIITETVIRYFMAYLVENKNNQDTGKSFNKLYLLRS